MPALQVKDFPVDLYEELRACAQAEDRSIAQQTTRILREYLREYRKVGGRVEFAVRPVDVTEAASASPRRAHRETEDEIAARIERRRRVFEHVHALPALKLPDDFPSAAELIREDRDHRDDWVVPGREGDR